MSVLVIDNYDSFTFNLVQALRSFGADVQVFRNDAIDVDGVRAMAPSHLVISPGPGRPEDAGNTLAILEAMLDRQPVLGVCLGHQSIAQVLGGRVDAATRLMHGKSSPVHHDGQTIYTGLSAPFEAGRYHSLAVFDLPSDLVAVAHSDDGEVMGVRHATLPVEGVQFHPESVLTPEGDDLLRNFLERL